MTRQQRLRDAFNGTAGGAADIIYSRLVHSLPWIQPFFSKGWGDLNVVDFNEDARAFQHWPPPHFDQLKIHWERKEAGKSKRSGHGFELLEGTFRTPCTGRIYDALPEESRTARVQLLLPAKSGAAHACVLHLAATGDQSFRGRIQLGAPLLSQGIATMVLESPFYGRRAPVLQQGSRLERVSDLLVLGRSTIEESLCLLHWAQAQGFARLGMSGFSMGGVHACMVASLYPFPIACTPLLAPRSAGAAYCKGALSVATGWRSLTSPLDERGKDVGDTVWRAAQHNLITSASLRVLQKPHIFRTLQQNSRDFSHAFTDSNSQPQHSPFGNIPPSAVPASDTSNCGTNDTEREMSRKARGQTQWGFNSGAVQRWLGGIWSSNRQTMPAHDTELARQRLEQVLETFTDITRFPVPQCPQAAVLVGAYEDQYVPSSSILELAEHWQGCELRWVHGGHVSAFVMQHPMFRRAILDSIARLPGTE
ncbi:hypothetical protein WJX73_007571 [Symbiochloris irregularis]|uniref:Uncharacterized protein n=1 Tax=Symbiochloris irregularis TaxID=706552 RepID=A0AAW1NTS0_9CHLO